MPPHLCDDWERQQKMLDELVTLSLAYHSPRELKELLDFAQRFPFHAPYNAMLLHMQNRGLQYAIQASQWTKLYGRRVKPGARAYVVLRFMGPVSFVFDLGDTEPIDPADDRVPQLAVNPFPAKGTPPPNTLKHLLQSCRKLLIEVEEKDLGTQLAGEARWFPGQNREYHVLLNSRHSESQKVGTLAHELGHIFCGHLQGESSIGWWEARINLSKAEREFEAEAVAYLVTSRMALEIGSASYLAEYLTPGSTLPKYSLETVLRAAGKVEEMTSSKFRVRKKNA